jgi:invasion protein IalB
MAVASQKKDLKNLQDTHIDWRVIIDEEDEFDEALCIIRHQIEDQKTRRGKFLLHFSIEKV